MISNEKILIFGMGWLGNKFHNYFEGSVLSSADITKKEEIVRDIEEYSPKVIINCAGKTGRPNIDWCEDHPLETIQSNVIGPILLAQICKERDIFLVHLGSGCIYEGDNGGKGFSEEDDANFTGSLYSCTKILSQKVLKNYSNVLIIRLRMPITNEYDQRNFLTKITKYNKIISINNSITVIEDMMKVTEELIKRKEVGEFNVTNLGVTNHKEIIKLYKEIVNPNHKCEFITLEELHSMTKAKRSNCVLNTQKLESKGINMRPLREALIDVLQKYKETIPKE